MATVVENTVPDHSISKVSQNLMLGLGSVAGAMLVEDSKVKKYSFYLQKTSQVTKYWE